MRGQAIHVDPCMHLAIFFIIAGPGEAPMGLHREYACRLCAAAEANWSILILGTLQALAIFPAYSLPPVMQLVFV
jgi:hypothetical protein